MMHYINKGGRPPVANKCSHHVKVSFDDLVVKELCANFTEKKAMTHLYKLEKATIELAKITAYVKVLSMQFDEQWSLKTR